jgi:hypothetical protein
MGEFDSSKLCISLLIVYLNKACLLVKLYNFFYYIFYVLCFVGPNAWKRGKMHKQCIFWWLMN